MVFSRECERGRANKPQAIEGVSDAQAAVSLTTNTLETARAVSPLPKRSRNPSSKRSAMNATLEIVPSVLDRIRKTLVGLKMPRALEVLDQTVRQLERGKSSALEVIDTLFAEELTLRENRRVKMALRMASSRPSRRSPASTSRSSRRSTATALSRSPNSILSTATR